MVREPIEGTVGPMQKEIGRRPTDLGRSQPGLRGEARSEKQENQSDTTHPETMTRRRLGGKSASVLGIGTLAGRSIPKLRAPSLEISDA
jgi:hypothetical protein